MKEGLRKLLRKVLCVFLAVVLALNPLDTRAIAAEAVEYGGTQTVAGEAAPGVSAVGEGVRAAFSFLLGAMAGEVARSTAPSPGQNTGSPQKDKEDKEDKGKKDDEQKYSLNDLKKDEANRVAKKFGYKNAEELKTDCLKDTKYTRESAHFNIKRDSRTRELVLESRRDSSIHVPTGLYDV